MKKLLLIPAVAMMIASCGGGDKCDPSTAEGAAKCICEMQAKADGEKDEAKSKELREEFGKMIETIEKNIEDGKYSENDVEAAANKIDGCKL